MSTNSVARTAVRWALCRGLAFTQFRAVHGREEHAVRHIDKNIVRSPYPELNLDSRTTVSDYIWSRFNDVSEKTALVCSDSGHSLSYRRLRKLSIDLAAWLQRVVGPGNTLTLLLPNCLEFAIATLAALEAGVVVSCVNPSFKTDELARQLEMANTKCIIAHSLKIPDVLEAKRLLENKKNREFPLIIVTLDDRLMFNGVLFFDEILKECEGEVKRGEPSAVDTALLLHNSTSSRGLPRPVRLSHSNIVANCSQMSVPEISPIRPDKQSTVAALLPMFHSYGLAHVLINGLRHGAKIVTVSKFKPDLFLESLKEHQVTVLPTVSALIHYLASSSVTKEDLIYLENVTVGGGPMPLTDLARLLEILPSNAEVMQVYGLSEGSIIFHQPKCSKKLNSIGQLLPNTEAVVVDINTGDELEDRREGEILVRGPQVMIGYREYEEEEESDGDGEWLRTGDLGYYDKDGFFYLTGRIKDTMRIDGFQVYPGELETVLRSHPEVDDVGVFGQPDEAGGDTGTAVIVPRTPAQPPSPKEIMDFLAARVAPYKKVSTVVFSDNIPRLSNGKVDRKRLTEANKIRKEVEFVALTYV